MQARHCFTRRCAPLVAIASSIALPCGVDLPAATDPASSGSTNPSIAVSGAISNASQSTQCQARQDALVRLAHAQSLNWDAFEKAVREFIKDFPDRSLGYQEMAFLMTAMSEQQEPDDELNRINHELALAKEMQSGSAPEAFKFWAEGFTHRLNAIQLRAAHLIVDGCIVDVPEEYRSWARDTLARLNSEDKPMTIRFTAVDGREVDLAQMRGRVVMVDFWSTGCPSYVARVPQIKAIYEKYHSQGFDIIGISADTDGQRLDSFLKENRIPWAQYFDGKGSPENKLFQAFGIWGVPHTMLVDKSGLLHGYDLSAEKLSAVIPKLLAGNGNDLFD